MRFQWLLLVVLSISGSSGLELESKVLILDQGDFSLSTEVTALMTVPSSPNLNKISRRTNENQIKKLWRTAFFRHDDMVKTNERTKTTVPFDSGSLKTGSSQRG